MENGYLLWLWNGDREKKSYSLPKQLIYLRHVLLSVSIVALFVAHSTQIPHNILIIHLDSASLLARITSIRFPRWNKSKRKFNIVHKGGKCVQQWWKWMMMEHINWEIYKRLQFPQCSRYIWDVDEIKHVGERKAR